MTARPARVHADAGPSRTRLPHASVTKVSSALAVLCEVDAGTCALSDPAGPPGATLEHLLSHSSGLPLDGTEPLARPGERRIYSNTGIELAVAHAAAAAGSSPADLVSQRVFGPLQMDDTELAGSAASGAFGTVVDLCALAGELLAPTLLTSKTAAAMRVVHGDGLVGVLPGFGRQVPCDWGLGVEVKGAKAPHWTGATWPNSTIGHFGQQGGFVVADVDAGVAIATLGSAPFGPWAVASWPAFTDRVRASVVG